MEPDTHGASQGRGTVKKVARVWRLVYDRKSETVRVMRQKNKVEIRKGKEHEK